VVERVKEVLFEVVVARAVDVDNREGKVIGTRGEGGGYRKVADRVLEELELPVIPGSEDTPRSSNRGFKNKRSKGRGKKGGSEEGGDVGEFGFLQKQNGGGGKLNCRPNVIALLTHPKATDVPAIDGELTRHGD
jgi:hypothetical protein